MYLIKSQNKSLYKFMNLKRKLLLCNSHINFEQAPPLCIHWPVYGGVADKKKICKRKNCVYLWMANKAETCSN
jgi:hypothetical protein